MTIPSKLVYDYLIRKNLNNTTTFSIPPAGSIQRQHIEKIIEQHGCVVLDSYNEVVYHCADSYLAAMIYSECNAANLIRRI